MANQTHKTIIFEEYDKTNPNNLYTLFNNFDVNEFNDAEIDRGLKDLTVSNFQQFLQKFSPKIYEVYSQNPQTGEIEFFYTTDPQMYSKYPHSEKKIEDHVYYKTFARLYENKGTSGKTNTQFDDDETLEMLTPKAELDEAFNIRQKFEYNLKKFHEAKARGDKSSMNTCTNKMIECREKIAEYADSPLTKLLPILIEDTKTKLKSLEGDTGNGNETGDDPKSLPARIFGVLYLTDDGKLKIDENWKENQQSALDAPKEEGTALVEVKNNLPAEVKTISTQTQVATIPDTQVLRNKIAETIIEDYDETVKKPDEKIKSLIVSTFAPLATVSTSGSTPAILDKAELMENLRIYENAYANAKKSFIGEMSKIVESFLGVKIFFDHATIEGGDSSEIPGGVIIANCKASKLLKIKDKFSKKMKALGKDQTEQRIWFAVVPNVLENPPSKNTTEDDPDDDGMGGSLRKHKEAKKEIDIDYVSINALKEFLPIMEAAEITTIFSIRKENGNTFSNLNVSEVEEKMKMFEPLNYGHSVYAYPNFTLILDKNYRLIKGQNETEITLPEIFIDAAYPAAGLLVASQQPKILDKRKLKIDKDAACVGVDLENLDVKRAFMTKFNRESNFRRTEDLVKLINKNMFGFVFSGDEVKENDVTWQNSYIHCARTLAKNEKTGIYKPIYQTLVGDFIYQELNQLPSRNIENVRKAVKKINQEWNEKNTLNKCERNVNFLLRKGESIEVVEDGDKVKIIIHFVGGDGYVEINVEGTTD